MPPPPPYRYWFLAGFANEPWLVQPFDAPRDLGWEVLAPMFVVPYLERWILEPESRATLYAIHAELFGGLATTAWGLGEERWSLLPLLLPAFERGDLVVLAARRMNATLQAPPLPPSPKTPSSPPPHAPPLPGDLAVLVVDRRTGKAVDGATVSITGPESASATTGGDGVFIFPDLTPGLYTITATKAGFGLAKGSATVIAGVKITPLRPRAARPLVASLAGGPGAPTPTLPAGPGATLTLGSTPFDLIVQVIDDSSGGSPIVGATVELALVSGASMGSKTTDSSGNSLFPSLNPDDYAVAASQPGFTKEAVSPVTLTQDQTVQVILHGALELGVTVVDEQGLVISGASVDLSGDGTGHLDTDGGGTGAFKNLRPGSYQVFVRQAGFLDTTSGPVTLVASSGSVKIVLINFGSLEVGVVEKGTGTVLSGHVSVARAVAGKAPFASDAPAAPGAPAFFPNIPVGAYNLVADAPGHFEGTGTATVPGGTTQKTTIELAPFINEVTVTVTDAGSPPTPVDQATVQMNSSAGASPSFNGTTAADGVVRFSPVPSGTFVATATAGLVVSTSPPVVVGPPPSKVDIPLVLQVLQLEVTVTDKATPPANLVGATVVVTAKSGPATFTQLTGPGGSVLFPRVPAGSYTVTASIAQHVDRSVDVVLGANSPKTSVTLALPLQMVIASKTVATSPANLTRTRVGIGEEVDLSLPTSASWTVSGGAATMSLSSGSKVTFRAGDHAATTTVVATTATSEGSITISVIEPSGYALEQAPGTNVKHINGRPTSGIKAIIFLLPGDVSFQNVQARELNDAGVGVGFYLTFNGIEHRGNGAGPSAFFTVNAPQPGKGSLIDSIDTLFSGDPGGPPSDGTLTFPVRWEYMVPVAKGGSGVSTGIVIETQISTADAAGTCTTSRGGLSITRLLADPTSTF